MLLDKEEAQMAIADINQYSGWKVSVYYSRKKYRKKQKKVKPIQKRKTKKPQTCHQSYDNRNEEIIVKHNRGKSKVECHTCGLKGPKSRNAKNESSTS